jgi:hypothetical protein
MPSEANLPHPPALPHAFAPTSLAQTRSPRTQQCRNPAMYDERHAPYCTYDLASFSVDLQSYNEDVEDYQTLEEPSIQISSDDDGATAHGSWRGGSAAGEQFSSQFALTFPLGRHQATLILSWHVPAHGRGTNGRPTSACLHALILATGCCCSTGRACFGGTCLTRCGVHGAGDGAELLPSRPL